MAAPSVTHTFSNSTTADATQVNTNFNDIINGVSDGTKDLTVSTVTVATITASTAIKLTTANTIGQTLISDGSNAVDYRFSHRHSASKTSAYTVVGNDDVVLCSTLNKLNQCGCLCFKLVLWSKS